MLINIFFMETFHITYISLYCTDIEIYMHFYILGIRYISFRLFPKSEISFVLFITNH
ncbi:hypothetical protein QBD00_004711 [Ochrobactrum sp. AN78]|nr:hypothetical protein [Ochrobactrum sp. AN78]